MHQPPSLQLEQRLTRSKEQCRAEGDPRDPPRAAAEKIDNPHRDVRPGALEEGWRVCWIAERGHLVIADANSEDIWLGS